MGQPTRTTAPTMTPARRLQRAYRASRGGLTVSPGRHYECQEGACRAR